MTLNCPKKDKMKTEITKEIQKKANSIARKAGYGRAIKLSLVTRMKFFIELILVIVNIQLENFVQKNVLEHIQQKVKEKKLMKRLVKPWLEMEMGILK